MYQNRIVANNLKNALQEYLNTQSVNIKVLRFFPLLTTANKFHHEMFSIKKMNDKNTNLTSLFVSLTLTKDAGIFFYQNVFFV